MNIVTGAQLMVGDKENSAGNLENFLRILGHFRRKIETLNKICISTS